MKIRTLFPLLRLPFRGFPYMLLLLVLPAGLWAQLPLIYNAGEAECPDGVTAYTNFTTLNVAETSYDDVYLTECAANGVRTYEIRDRDILPGNAYTIYLHFAEIYHGAGNPNPSGGDGSRIFSVSIEGVRVLDSLDIHKEVGPAEALVYRYDVWVNEDSAITLTFEAVRGRSKVSALELHRLGEATAFPPENAIRMLNVISLPVEWGLFDLHTQPDGTLNLSWTTLREENTARFEVEVSTDGQTYQTLGSRPAAGYSETVQQYDFQTRSLDPGRYVFRLKQVDIDGQYSYSPRREYLLSTGMGLALAYPTPNPAQDQARIQVMPRESGILRLRLYGLDGREIRRFADQPLQAGSASEIPLDLHNLAQGTYLLALEAAGERAHHLIRVQ